MDEELGSLAGQDAVVLDQGAERWVLDAAGAGRVSRAILQVLVDFHQASPLAPGISLEELRRRGAPHTPAPLTEQVLTGLQSSGKIRLEGRRAALAADWLQRVQDADERELTDWVMLDRVAAALAAALGEACARSENERVSSGVVSLRALAQRAGEDRWVSGRDLRGWGMDEGPELGAVLAEAARGQLQRRWESAEEAGDWARGRAAISRHGAVTGSAGKDDYSVPFQMVKCSSSNELFADGRDFNSTHDPCRLAYFF